MSVGLRPLLNDGANLIFDITAYPCYLFDVEVVFLFPWAASFGTMSGEFGLFVLGEMTVFIGILMLGWIYAWKKGSLEWS